jgi:hypothetical protein
MRAYSFLTIAAATSILAACTADSAAPQASASNAQSAPLYVRDAMQNEVNPAIVAIWDVTNNAYNDDGELDASLISPEQWNSLAEQAGVLAAIGDRMAAASELHAASEGNWATGEYEVPMDQVQGNLDADPQGYRDMSVGFAALSRNVAAAASAMDLQAATDLVGQMDSECAACHQQYWYAEQ